MDKKIAKQTLTGKAFEYSLLNEFYERLSIITKVSVIKDDPYITALTCFNSFNETEQNQYRLTASFAVNFLLDIEPRLSNGITLHDNLQLQILSDYQGQSGDVRDVLAIRLLQGWEIGISAKNNHYAVKHSRLSNDIDFGEKWLNTPCSNNYFNVVNPIFDNLAEIRKISKATHKWSVLGNHQTSVYIPILNAFKDELLRLDENNPGIVAKRLVEYLIGNKDFYKVIKTKGKVEIQAYNIQGSLNLPIGKNKPKDKIPRIKLPNRLIEVVYKNNSKTTLLVTMDEGWQISFRIHTAKSTIEPSLKFDINLVSAPHSLYKNKLFVR